nr:T9SS type A sorting domain-containing protein [Bacteroidota bacterium]
MKNSLKIYFTLVALFIFNFVFAQQQIQINNTFSSDTVIEPFTQIEIFGCQITGSLTLNSDTSFVRLFLKDEDDVEHILFESYPMINDSQISFTDTCYETMYIEGNRPEEIKIDVNDASITISYLLVDTTYNSDYSSLQATFRDNIDSIKVAQINNYLETNDIPWRAGQSDFSDIPYESKKHLLGNALSISELQGIEFYAGGFFPFGLVSENTESITITENFDWRSRHGANNPLSPYYDNDPTGSGWIPPRFTGQGCADCWAFAPVYTLEALINLYFNQHLDKNLSEQHIVSCVGDEICATGGSPLAAANYIVNNGVVLENCFPYDPQDGVPCEDVCNDPDDVFTPENKFTIYGNNNGDAIMENIINYGPGSTTMIIWGHAMSLVGYGKIQIGDLILDGNHSHTGLEITVLPGSSWIGNTYWIFKQSWGDWGANGTPYIYVIADPDKLYYTQYFTTEINSNVYDSTDVQCLDLDGDGYYYWGIGPKPAHCDSCPATPDCDDSNPFLTYYDSLYNCFIDCESFVYDTNAFVITTNTVLLPGPYNTDIVVQNGAVLEIYDAVLFHEDAKIIIQPGGKLILDGGTLTNACGDYWQGIEVWGNPSASQIAANQGILEVKHGGTIENAEVAVRVGSEDYTGKGGGMVYADDGIFLNNDIGAWFDPYSYASDNVSYFNECTFDYTDPISGEGTFTFVKLNDVHHVSFIECAFTNNSNHVFTGLGIESTNAIFSVEGFCTAYSGDDCTAWDSSYFYNLDYGIYATASNSTDLADVRHTTFEDNYKGIYLSGMTLPRVTSNQFYLDTTAAAESYGLYLDECTQYWVEDNNFEKNSGRPSQTGIGIYVNESGAQANEIYLNYFDNVEYAVIALGVNRSTRTSATGLVIRCNDYNNTLFDETIIYDGVSDPPEDGEGIASNQGQNTTNAVDMAGNLFYYNTSTSGDYDDLDNESNHFYYYYSNSAGGYDVEPLDITGSTVTKVPKYSYNWTYAAGCPSGLTSGGGGGSEESRSAMIEAQSDIATTEAVLIALVDGGDTETLNAEVESSIPPEAAEVYTELMAESPNLSETVVETSIEKEEVLPNAMIRDVMVANPHTASSLALLSKLDDRSNPMPAYMKAQILAGRSITSLKADLEGQIAGHKLRKARAMKHLARYFGTMPEYPAVTDSLLALYQLDNSLDSRYMQAWLHLHSGQYQQGQAVITTIPTAFALTADELALHQNMQWIYTTLKGLFEAGNGVAELSQAQIGQLQGIVSDETGIASVYARNLLLAIDELEYEEPVILPDHMKSTEVEKAFNELLNTPAPKMLEVYPNPSKDFVILGYHFDKETQGTIEIRDMSGRLMESIAFKGMQDQVTVTTRGWTPGVYVLSLVVKDKVIESTKFTLIN